MIDLCQLAAVKALVGIEDEVTTEDATLTHIITAVSAQLQRYLNRWIEATSYTEYFDVHDDAEVFSVHAYPITALTSVKNAVDWTWSATSSISTTYTNYNAHDGLVYVYGQQLAEGYGALQIVYTGGMAANTDELVSGEYADIALACEQQVIAVWRNKSAFGVGSAGGGNATAQYNGVKILDSVRDILDQHRRRIIV